MCRRHAARVDDRVFYPAPDLIADSCDGWHIHALEPATRLRSLNCNCLRCCCCLLCIAIRCDRCNGVLSSCLTRSCRHHRTEYRSSLGRRSSKICTTRDLLLIIRIECLWLLLLRIEIIWVRSLWDSQCLSHRWRWLRLSFIQDCGQGFGQLWLLSEVGRVDHVVEDARTTNGHIFRSKICIIKRWFIQGGSLPVIFLKIYAGSFCCLFYFYKGLKLKLVFQIVLSGLSSW